MQTNEQGDLRNDDLQSLQGGFTSSRRTFLFMGLGLLATGCAQPTKTVSGLPGPQWPDHVPSGNVASDSHLPDPTVIESNYALPGGVMSRLRWAKGQPQPSMMDRMIPIRYITVHHDGMDPFYGDSSAAAADRLELIRRGHRGRSWGDIGYHYIIDRSGRVWEGRPLAYQGAHVKDHNEGNIGVMCLGNFEQQAPTVAQVSGLDRHLTLLMSRHHVATRNVRTHQEWASTACPGRNLQQHMDAVRRNINAG